MVSSSLKFTTPPGTLLFCFSVSIKVLWHVPDEGADGIDLLERLLDRYGETADYVVVKNQGRGKDFSAFETSSARATADAARPNKLPQYPEQPARKAMRAKAQSHHSAWPTGSAPTRCAAAAFS